MRNLGELTWKEIKALNKTRSVVFAVFAPIEEHSLCLPLATDLIEGEAWMARAMEQLESKADLDCFYLPAFPIAAASVNDFYGCIHFTMQTTYSVVFEFLENLVHMDFKHIVIIASHADVEHQIAVEAAVDEINKTYGIRAISPMGAYFSADELNLKRAASKEILERQAQYPNDFHAGWIETSCMLAIDESKVREGYRNLPSTMITQKDMISKEKQRQAMGDFGHMGSPAAADKKVGELLNEEVEDFLFEAVSSFVKREDYQIYTHHFLYRIQELHRGLNSYKAEDRKETKKYVY